MPGVSRQQRGLERRGAIMKSPKALFIVLATALLIGGSSRPARAGVSFDFFFSQLSPHGHWLDSGSYGRVWQPAEASRGWNPYFDGDWEYTDDGWSWQSDYQWGGIPYHYGTWVQVPVSGWVWVPGYDYAPSWVVFRQGPDYIGWSPVRPGFSFGISFSNREFDDRDCVFVRASSFGVGRVRENVVPEREYGSLVNRTSIVRNSIDHGNNRFVNRGPDVGLVERSTHRTIRPVRVDGGRNGGFDRNPPVDHSQPVFHNRPEGRNNPGGGSPHAAAPRHESGPPSAHDGSRHHQDKPSGHEAGAKQGGNRQEGTKHRTDKPSRNPKKG
jgi:hypothetical protein